MLICELRNMQINLIRNLLYLHLFTLLAYYFIKTSNPYLNPLLPQTPDYLDIPCLPSFFLLL